MVGARGALCGGGSVRVRCCFEDEMCIGAAEPKGTDASQTCLCGPGGILGWHCHGQGRPVDMGVGLAKVQMGRNFAMLQSECDLHQAGHTGRRLQVADIGFG